jgi:hypothetical protein
MRMVERQKAESRGQNHKEVLFLILPSRSALCILKFPWSNAPQDEESLVLLGQHARAQDVGRRDV